MRKSLLLVAVALSFGPGAVAQEKLSLDITAHIQDAGDRAGMDSQWLGTTGKRLELINIKKRSGPKNVKIQYRCIIKDSGETAWMDEGKDCGTRGQGKALLAFAVRLAGEGSQNYKLWYQCQKAGSAVPLFTGSPAYCDKKDKGAPNLEALNINVDPRTKEDQGYADETIFVNAYRLKLADPPKVAFLASVYGDLSSFYIAYRPKDSSVPLKNTPVITIGPNDGNTKSQQGDIYGRYGDVSGRKDQLVTEALVPNTEYVYWLIGNYKDGKEYKSPDLAFQTTPLAGLKMGLLTDEASQYGWSSIRFAGAIGKAKEHGVAYIEYGTNPSKLDQKTKEKNFSKGDDVLYSDVADLVLPATTYYYRLAADYMGGDTAKGNTLSFKSKDVTVNAGNPCKGLAEDKGPFAYRLSEDLVVVCNNHGLGPSVGYGLSKGGAVEDRLVCPEQFPRNLNTNPFDFKIPKTDVGLSWEKAGPGFWRSSDDVRFNDWEVWATKGDQGQQQPLRRGSQKYWAINWNPKKQTLTVWIYCSSNWSSPNTFK
jgi:hypothetical protein